MRCLFVKEKKKKVVKQKQIEQTTSSTETVDVAASTDNIDKSIMKFDELSIKENESIDSSAVNQNDAAKVEK